MADPIDLRTALAARLDLPGPPAGPGVPALRAAQRYLAEADPERRIAGFAAADPESGASIAETPARLVLRAPGQPRLVTAVNGRAAAALPSAATAVPKTTDEVVDQV